MTQTSVMNDWPQPITATIDGGALDVWHINLDNLDQAAWSETLTAAEFARAARLLRPGAGERFLQARFALRSLLGRYLDRVPQSLEFALNQFGKPALPGSQLGFNLSHSGNRAVLAISRQQAIGVDIEQLTAHRDVHGLARQVCTPSESADLAALPDQALALAFSICWTRKEAYLKALGVGLSVDPRVVAVGLLPIPLHVSEVFSGSGSVAVQTIDISDGFAISVAVRSDHRRVSDSVNLRQFERMKY